MNSLDKMTPDQREFREMLNQVRSGEVKHRGLLYNYAKLIVDAEDSVERCMRELKRIEDEIGEEGDK